MRIWRVAFLGVLVATALIAATGTHGAISSVSGQVQLIAPPPSVQLGALQSDTTMFAFDERQNVTLSAPLPVDISQPGQYGPNSGPDPLTPGTIPAGTTVSSQFVHADPVGHASPPNVLNATIVTSTNILGIEVCGPAKPDVCQHQHGLDDSDAVLGAPGTSYPTGVFGRGMNFATQPDILVWMVDNRTVVIQTSTDLHADQVRIITAGDGPSTGEITPTNVDCQTFVNGTPALGQINYSTDSSGKIGQGINPGVFFYWTKITTSAANQTVTVSQSNTSTNNAALFGVHQGWDRLYKGDCSSWTAGTVIGSNGSGASFTVPTPGNYVIGVKYSTKTIAGTTAPVPANITYTFTTSLGALTAASVPLVKQ
jgi:hypothetical protein